MRYGCFWGLLYTISWKLFSLFQWLLFLRYECIQLIEKIRMCTLSFSDRNQLVTRHHLCMNCLRKAHEIKTCDSNRYCSKCNPSHHTLLYSVDANFNPAAPAKLIATTSFSVNQSSSSLEQSLPSTSARCVPHQTFHLAQNKSVLLGTAMVFIVYHGVYSVRVLIDPASESSSLS